MTNTKSRIKIIVATLIAVFVAAALCFIFTSCQPKKKVGIAWTVKDNYGSVERALQEAGCSPILLDPIVYSGFDYDETEKISDSALDQYGMLSYESAEKIKAKPYDSTNVKQALYGCEAVVFPGGTDVSPSLYADPKPWYDYSDKPQFNATRDVSDYILMSYCLDNDIPVMGICRGMQLYNVVSGGTMIQDLPTYYKEKGVAYQTEHQKIGELDGKKIYGNHPVYITDKSSMLYECWQKDIIDNPVSSHHQAVLAPNTAKAKVTAVGKVNGVETVEALERIDGNAFGFFLQFHPEISLAHWIDDQADKDYYLGYEDSLKFFQYFASKI